jgi:hypothetical protein
VIGLGNTDAFSGFRVATWSRSPSPYGKRAKATELYAIAAGEGSGDRVENGIDAFIDVGGAQVRTLSGDTMDQFRFEHAILRLQGLSVALSALMRGPEMNTLTRREPSLNQRGGRRTT